MKFELHCLKLGVFMTVFAPFNAQDKSEEIDFKEKNEIFIDFLYLSQHHL